MPKFRAWDKIDNLMKMVHSINFHDKVVILQDKVGCRVQRLFTDVELMQSTGLKDKNGVEIFESDIFVTESDKVYIIIRGKSGLYKAVEKTEDEIYYLTLADVCDLLEVVGNIYENLKLLED